ncbi:MAG: hypothetical protein J6A96_03170 [Clostridia bacterium]|nr:hypothetical protein [Clostridia bacterium]
MPALDYSSNIIEPFAQTTISLSYDNVYSTFVWNKKADDFDFTSPDKKIALEVVSVIPENIIEACKYEKVLAKGKKPTSINIKMAKIDASGSLISYYGGSMTEIRRAIIKAIETKHEKAVKRLIKYDVYELCICTDDGALFNSNLSFDFLLESELLSKACFSRIFIITSAHFFVIENSIISEYERKIS